MKTKDRIIQGSIILFNERGTANVTTNHIAEYLGISPGNLYYHFRNKEEIIFAVFQDIEGVIQKSSTIYLNQNLSLNDVENYIYVMFNALWEHYFFFRDLPQLLRKSTELECAYRNLREQYMDELSTLCCRLEENQLMKPFESDDERSALTVNVWVLATSWASYLETTGDTITPGNLRQGLEQISFLLKPYFLDSINVFIHETMKRFAAQLEQNALQKKKLI